VAPNKPVALADVPAATQPSAGPMAPAEVPSSGALQAGLEAKSSGAVLEARRQLRAAMEGGLTAEDMRTARVALAELAKQTLFSRALVEGDQLTEGYTVRPGDSLVRIADRHDVTEDLLAEVNLIRNKNYIREGQRLKVLKGPFHAVVSKTDHLAHVFLQDTYVSTYRVALGANGGTPTGKWKVANKLANPGWTDPRDGKHWHADDPANPIGEFWIGLEGVEGDAVGQFGYGIHGTIEPETIGQDVSLGCVRLAADDIAAVYKLLVPGKSLVTIEK
jgi:lipoprotein-anchoring transpeptidase ErfK/SrfK